MARSNASALIAIDVRRRDRRFAVDGADLRHWHPRGLHVSHFFNALSLFFPDGEQFFIDSVRHYRDRLEDPALRESVRGFIGQEAMHGREHRAYNDSLRAAGYPVDEIEARIRRILGFARAHLSPAHQLAGTIALEHFTAILADVVLRDARVLEGADPAMASLWRWHALEETEHKAVAFDVYRAVVSGRRRYWLRVGVMTGITLRFLREIAGAHWALLRHDGRRADWRGWLALLGLLFGKPGVFRQIAGPWLDYFRPRFHPWQHDNRALLQRWQPDYDPDGATPAA